jgi:hypothetical protein
MALRIAPHIRREHTILLEYIHGTSQKDIAAKQQISHQRVNQILTRVMERLRITPLTPKEHVGNIVLRDLEGTPSDIHTPAGFYYRGQLVRSDPWEVFEVHGGRAKYGPWNQP